MKLRLFAAMLLAPPAVAWAQANLEKQLQLRLALGEFGQPGCVSVANLRPVEQGFDDIRFEALPGAHRVVLVPASSGWRMTNGLPELQVLAAAGFYTMRETTFVASTGETHPAREFRLTRKGYLATARRGQQCYDFVNFASVELISSEQIEVSDRLAGLGQAYLVKFRIHHSEPRPWARTPEFRYVYARASTPARHAAGPVSKAQTFFLHDGNWFSDREAMMVLSLAAAGLRPGLRAQAESAEERLAAETPERRMARLGAATVPALREEFSSEQRRREIEPCLDLPVREADVSGGFWKKDMPPTFVLYEQSDRRDTSRHDHALEFLRRLEKAGLVRAEPFDGEPFAEGRKGKGLRFVLSEEAAASLGPQRPHCLPLGQGEIEELQPGHVGQNGADFRAWLRVSQPRRWTMALAEQFPSVSALLEHGYGATVTVPTRGSAEIRIQLQTPTFARKQPARPVRVAPFVVPEGPGIVDDAQEGPVRMMSDGCAVSADGTEVAGTKRSCGQARASRAYRSGKAYAEIVFQGKSADARPDTWTNAAVTSKRSLYSLSTGAAHFSFAGGFHKHLIKHGDVISIALDLDSRVLYWRLNGEWMTGRPGTGLGEPMLHPNDEYFIAVSVQDKAEAWRVNFGAAPFRFPAPDGFPAYGARP